MKNRLMPTLIALVIFALLYTYASLYENEDENDILPPGAQKQELLLSCRPNDITQIAFYNGPKETFKIVSNASESFCITASNSFIADANEVEGIKRHFAELKYEMIVAENASNSADFGITPESMAVILTTAAGSVKLTLGDKLEIGGSYYLTKEADSRIYMAPGFIKGDFAKTVNDVRNRRRFIKELGNIVKVCVKNKKETIELHLDKKQNAWLIDKPVKKAADAVAVSETIDKFKNLTISRFVSDAKTTEDFGFKEENRSVTLVNSEGAAYTLEIGKTSQGEVYTRIVGEEAVHASLNTDIAYLTRSVNDFREKYITAPALADIDELTISDASGTIVIEKKEGKWLIGTQKVENDDVKDFVQGIGQAKIFEFAAAGKEAEYGLKHKENCKYALIKTKSGMFELYLGNKTGVNLAVKADSELLLVSASLDDAFTKFMKQIQPGQSPN